MKEVELGPDDILEWGDIIRYLDGSVYLIVQGLAGNPVRNYPDKRCFRMVKGKPGPKVKLCDECYTRHKPGENELCSQ